jgi:hypothetical protein
MSWKMKFAMVRIIQSIDIFQIFRPVRKTGRISLIRKAG